MVSLGKHAKYEILEAIQQAEKQTTAEIRVHLKPRCKEDILEEAKTVFRKLGMHRTRERSGVLIFVALQNRSFAIIGDEGIHQKVGDTFWNATRDEMTTLFSEGRKIDGILAGIRSAGEKLRVHFPATGDNPDELTNEASEG